MPVYPIQHVPIVKSKRPENSGFYNDFRPSSLYSVYVYRLCTYFFNYDNTIGTLYSMQRRGAMSHYSESRN